MSFILDALKKSESERHRNSGPVLMDVRIAPPRRRLPVWAWVIVAVLGINLLILAWLLWRSPRRSETPQVATQATPAAAVPAAQSQPPPAQPQPAVVLPEPTLPPAQPAPPATAVTMPTPGASSTAASPAIDTAGLPRYQDLVSSGVALPTLQLNLHVHDAQPANRYVLLNGVKLREGEFTPEGVKVLQIVPAGVVLEMRGQRFFLAAGG
jgi:general secretion pathway protein B